MSVDKKNCIDDAFDLLLSIDIDDNEQKLYGAIPYYNEPSPVSQLSSFDDDDDDHICDKPMKCTLPYDPLKPSTINENSESSGAQGAVKRVSF